MPLNPDASVVVTTPRLINLPFPTGDFRWLYLGKEVGRSEQVESHLGGARRYCLGDRLHVVASELRQPFLDFVAALGVKQENKIVWWSTALSWKSWGATDLFLLLCYLRLAEDMLAEAVEGRSQFFLIIEDPWLFKQLKRNGTGWDGVVFRKGEGLVRLKLRAVVSGMARRVAWFSKVLTHYLRQRWIWPRSFEPTEMPTIGFYTLPLNRCLRENGQWEDPFLPGLDRFLRQVGYHVVRFAPPECPGFEKEIAERSRYFEPLVLHITLSAIARSLLAVWWLRSTGVQLAVCGVDIEHLIERECWIELSHSRLSVYRMFYECFRKMLEKRDWRWIVYPYENQPWEKLIALCAKEMKIRTVGFQHSTLATLYLPYFLGSGEDEHMPLPDLICTAGSYPHQLLKRSGVPSQRLRMCGSIRYRHLTHQEPLSGQSDDLASPSQILVALPIDIYMSRHLLAAIRRAFPDGGQREGLTFYIKVHPSSPVLEKDIGFAHRQAPKALDKAFERCGTVVFIGSTVGPEAVAWGRVAVRYRSGLLLNVDPSEAYGESIEGCDDTNIRQVLLGIASGHRRQPKAGDISSVTNTLFAPLNYQMLTDIFSLSDPADSKMN